MIRKPKSIPNAPGVYRFIAKTGTVLYVGRAINLRRRVAQYFSSRVDSRIAEMVQKAARVETQKTHNLLEAIILEANLIKKYWPKYNIRERDDTSFSYIVIPKVEFPEPVVVRGKRLKDFPKKQNWIFGPYQGVGLLKNALRLIRRVIPFSTCKPFDKQGLRQAQAKPCFDYQIGLCPGLCIGAVSQQDYQTNIKNLVLLLSGKSKTVLEHLKRENPDRARILQHLQDVSLTAREASLGSETAFGRIEGYDISHLSGKETYGAMAVMTDGGIDKTQYRMFKIRHAAANDDLAALGEMLSRRLAHREWQYPDLILVDGGRPQVRQYSHILKNVRILIPVAGISKYEHDILVFDAGLSVRTKNKIRVLKRDLIRLRDEAHRFANKGRRLGLKLDRK
jgi:excinuclease ABC subunit C